jgi:hypothetical protein
LIDLRLVIHPQFSDQIGWCRVDCRSYQSPTRSTGSWLIFVGILVAPDRVHPGRLPILDPIALTESTKYMARSDRSKIQKRKKTAMGCLTSPRRQSVPRRRCASIALCLIARIDRVTCSLALHHKRSLSSCVSRPSTCP